MGTDEGPAEESAQSVVDAAGPGLEVRCVIPLPRTMRALLVRRSTWTAYGAVAPETAWERYTDPTTWPDWAPQLRSTSGLSAPLQAGDHGTVHGPLAFRVPVHVMAVDHGARKWSWRVGSWPTVTMEHGIAATSRGTRAWVRIHLPPVLLLPYRPLAEAALRRLVAPDSDQPETPDE